MVVLEAWLAGTPVHRERPLAGPARALPRSGGGLPYASRAELVEALDLLTGDPGAARPARRGRAPRYTRATFSWPRCGERFLGALEEWS